MKDYNKYKKCTAVYFLTLLDWIEARSIRLLIKARDKKRVGNLFWSVICITI
jgi:hypothetical protein